MLKDVEYPQPYLRLFPSPDTVFVEPVKRYYDNLLPLVSIDLSVLDNSLSGWLPVVCPLETADGYPGEHGKEYWGAYLQPNWIGFRLTEDGKYELLGDFRYFALEDEDGEELYEGSKDEIREHSEELRESYEERKSEFESSGEFEGEAVSRIGGLSTAENLPEVMLSKASFSYAEPMNDDDDFDDENYDEDAYDGGVPKTSDGRDYLFVAAVDPTLYMDSGPESVVVFYDPVERIVLHSFVFG